MTKESILHKISTVKWIKPGDSSNKNFVVVMKKRCHKKQILDFTTTSDSKVTIQGSIRDGIVNSYKGLMESSTHSLPTINKDIIKYGLKLSYDNNYSSVLRWLKKIYEGFCAINDDKEPGIDRYNSCLFKKECPLIKE